MQKNTRKKKKERPLKVILIYTQVWETLVLNNVYCTLDVNLNEV